jgi:DNA ligase D-like protein (predicted polymerase)/DNA ligase D-like protein (predicted 3'-phosphoesterase)
MSLEIYQQKRDFKQTPEPKGKVAKTNKYRFVCQEHHASNLHFDFRLEIGGVLKSWSLRKGPSMDPDVKRLAVPTEDHPVEYLKFQGDIPKGNYGAGQHRIWDEGNYKLLDGDNVEDQFKKGKLKLELDGKKLRGNFALFKLGDRDQWLMVKGKDGYAESGWELKLLLPDKEGSTVIKDEPKQRIRSVAEKFSSTREKRNKPVVKTPARPSQRENLPTISELLDQNDLKGDHRVKVDGFAVNLTSLDRVYWPDEGYTKTDLLRYYADVAPFILPYLKDRPLIMKRYPTGISGISFHQHDVDDVPEFVDTIELEAENQSGKHMVDYVICSNVATHLYVANLGAIERHPWHSTVKKLHEPTWFVFDLDPGDEVEFESICEVAVSARDIIADLGIGSYAKTSGSRGIHVYVPIQPGYSYEQVADLAAAIAKMVANEIPNSATIERGKAKRKNDQIYVDHLQNAYGKSVVAPYSVRPKPGATVSAPLDWNEVEKKNIRTTDFTIKNMLARLKNKGDIFNPVLTKRQSLDQAFKKANIRTNGR